MPENRFASQTALILAPTLNDGTMAAQVLKSADVDAVACGTIEELCERAKSGCGVLLISEEALSTSVIAQLQTLIDSQAPWSDLPIILLTNTDVVKATEVFSKSGNISLLERPFSRLTLVRSVEVALRSRLKQYEVRDLLQALSGSKTEAERANQAKSQFLANMSHEIRTPIGVITGFMDLMKKSEDPAKALEYMSIVERNSEHLLRLIDDILDLSKVEAGKLAIEQVSFSLQDFLSDIAFNMNFKAVLKGIEFRIQFLTAVPEAITSDPGRLRQILTNVIGNAIKFTEVGHIALEISFVGEELIFDVKDTGVGLSKEQAARLFQPFMQADTSTTRKFGGTGLGLVLSKRLSEALGGGLALSESEPGVGSRFTVKIKPEVSAKTLMTGDIDLAHEPTSQRSPGPEAVLLGLRVLLVEDSPDNQELISTYLEMAGATVAIENNGADGFRAALEGSFDVVLMDLQMPVRDGHQTTRDLRKEGFAQPILALTAHAMNEERVRCIESGFNDYITKPIDFRMLIQSLSHYARSRKAWSSDNGHAH